MYASFFNYAKKISVFICSALIMAHAAPAFAKPAQYTTTEHVYGEFTGTRDYLDVLFNIDFQDIGESWARGAIYETGALGIIKGFGSPVYGGSQPVTKGQAIALTVRAAGLESAAQIEGETIEAVNRKLGRAPSDAETIWINGSLKLAADIGMISASDYAAAMGDAAAQASTAFRRNSPAQRQEFAYWIAVALDIPAFRGQEAVFVDYTDWNSVDAVYVPYIEAILREKIIKGDSFGRIFPRDPVTREQAAQIIKNASKFVFAKNGFTESSGTIEKIVNDTAAAPDGAIAEVIRSVYYIRNHIGRLDTVTTGIAASDSAGEASAARRGTGLVVYTGGSLEDETVLRAGDRIRYITSRNRDPGYPDEARYIEIIQSGQDRSYVLAQIDGIDAVNRRISFTQIFPVVFPYTGELRRAAEAPRELLRLSAEYIYSEDVSVKKGGAYTDIGSLSVGMNVIIGIENFRNLFYVETVGAGYHLGETGIARGIIEENNPVLGYVSMYSESGDRTGVRSLGNDGERPELMIYNYVDPDSVDARKDGYPVSIGDLSAGDSAFVKFGDYGELEAISAVTNYKSRYGVIISLSGNELIVNFNDSPGAAHSLELGPDVLYFKDYRLSGKSALTPGSEVRILLRDLGGASEVREITVMHESDRGLAGSVYKAVLSRIDETSQKAVIYNVQKLVKGKWERTDRKGFDTVAVNSSTRFYMNNAQTNLAKANKMLRDNDVYISVKNDYGGVEVAAQISAHSPDDKELLYDGVVGSVRRPAGMFGIVNGPSDIAAGSWTIVVKDGKLITNAAIEQDDLAYVVASREDATGRMRADVIEIGDRSVNSGVHIYRGRVISVSKNKSFTLESFSELDLNGTEWKFSNTPKTFTLAFNTLFLTEEGITSTDFFDGRGQFDYTYPPRTVYVLSDGTEALAVSTAPYGMDNIRGDIIEMSGLVFDGDGVSYEGPSGFTLSGVSYYDRVKYGWIARKGDAAFILAPYTLIIKNGAAVKPSALRKSDAVRIIWSGAGVGNVPSASTLLGFAYIVIIEN